MLWFKLERKPAVKLWRHTRQLPRWPWHLGSPKRYRRRHFRGSDGARYARVIEFEKAYQARLRRFNFSKLDDVGTGRAPRHECWYELRNENAELRGRRRIMAKIEPIEVELAFTEELLGTASANPEAYREWIASKAPTDEATDQEAEALPDVEEELQKSMTVFPRDEQGRPFLYDYQIKGFFKDACGMLRRLGDGASKKIKAYKKEIDGLIFVEPRQIILELPEGQELGICERPLRAATAQGERIALARSETAPPGTKLHFKVSVLKIDLVDAIEQWLRYGRLRGLGQWRNSGKGRFDYSWRHNGNG